METQNEKREIGKVLLKIFLVLFSVFIVIVIIGGVVRGISGDKTLTLASLVKRIVSGENIIQKNGNQTANMLAASTEESSVQLSNPNKNIKMQIAAADKSLWPQDVVGGLYKLDPSQDSFDQPLNFRIKLKKDPGPWFSLGYWHPESGQWEQLPTVKRGEGIYETVLLHASYIGGANADSYQPTFLDGENQGMGNGVGEELEKLQGENADGENRGGSWEKAWNDAKALTDKLISDYCANKNPQTIHDFMAGWEMADNLGFKSLSARYLKAFFTDCGRKKENIGYEITQVDYYDTAINLNLMQGAYQLNSKNKTQTVSTGWPQEKGDGIIWGEYVDVETPPSWRTEWKVDQGSALVSDIEQKLYQEDKSPDAYGLIDFRGKTTGEGTALQNLSFDLTNVKEGGNFPISVTFESGLMFRTDGHSLTGLVIIKNQDGTFNWQKSDNKNFSEDFGDPAPVTLTGILLKDNGEEGAIIGFKEQYFTPEQMEQMKQIQEIAKTGPAELQNLWGEDGKPNFMSGDLLPKPLFIKRSTAPGEQPNPEDDYKDADSKLKSQREQDEKQKQEEEEEKKNKDNEEDTSGLPDLVPEGQFEITN